MENKPLSRTFYFNTGVRRDAFQNPPVSLGKGQIWSPNGVKVIPFDCYDVPKNAVFKFACDDPNLKESKIQGYLVREIHNSTLISKYAYFFVQQKIS